MTAGLDLSGVAAWLNTDVLVDDVVVWREQPGNGELNEETGEIEDATATTVYLDKGAIVPMGGGGGVPDPETQRVLRETTARHRGLLPLTLTGTQEFLPGDLMRVLAAHAPLPDPLITDRVFKVIELATVSTFTVVRVLYLEEIGRD